MSGRFYDVIIVGAGPAGSYIAYELASRGHNVGVFEQRSVLETNTCCTGIISTECFCSLELSPELVLTKVNSAKFFPPSGKYLRLQTENVQAYVVNRLLLDKALASKAQSQGAQYFYSSPVIDVIPGKDSIQVEALCSRASEIFSARAVVLANGFRPKLPKKLGLGKIKSFLIGAQAEVEAKDVGELEVYFSQKIAPGGFAWLVPTCVGTSPNKAYVGLLATSQAKLHLQKFLNNLFSQSKITSREVKIEQKAIPVGTLARSYRDRILVIGDAAGQVKPTTGGGIYFGHLGARIAARVLDEALHSDNLTADRLSRYQKEWKAKMGRELSRGYWARRAYAKLGDRQIEAIFNALDPNGLAKALLKPDNFSFDWHSRFILAILRHSSAYPWLKIRRLLLREASL
ncbi:MAG: NAD(P)/FAD-dependent oxidoreductase [Chloroflexi bacterium]|nr:NAD(P)/FAD-dependent oxidoreductase [Chloroflexota bacterium]